MTNIETRHLFYRKQQYWFCPVPFDSPRCSAVHFYAVPRKVDIPGFTCKPSPTLLIDLQQDTDTLRSNLGRSCRNQINKASRKDFVIKKNQHHKAFFELYKNFVKDKGFSENLENYWPITEQGTLYTCYHNDALIAGFLTLEDDHHSRWLMSGSIRLSLKETENRNLIGLANRALIWEAINDARARGKTWFDFGGIYTGDNKSHPGFGIARFKRDFGGKEVTQYKYSRVYSPWLRRLKRIKAMLKNRNFDHYAKHP